MTVRELFGGAIRIVGVWEAVRSLNSVYYVIAKLAHLQTNSTLPIATDLATGAFALIVGVSVVACAEPIVRLVYGPAPATAPSS
jgi:hypothetical protein